MTDLVLDYELDEARELIEEAFRRTTGISEIEEGGHQMVGKTGISFPRVLWSYGENVYVDFSDPTEDGKVPVEVWAEKSIWTNVTANPQAFKREFLTELEAIRGQPVESPDREAVDSDDGRSSSNRVLGALGYPVSAVTGGFLGVVLAAGIATTAFGSPTDGAAVVGILGGAFAGGALWFHRGKSSVRSAGTYVGLAFVGVLLTALVQTALDLRGTVGTVLFVVFVVGMPLSAYLLRNSISR